MLLSVFHLKPWLWLSFNYVSLVSYSWIGIVTILLTLSGVTLFFFYELLAFLYLERNNAGHPMLNYYEWTSWLSLHPDEMKLAQILDQILDAMNENMDDLPWLRTINWNHFIILLDSLNYRITQSNLSLSLRGLQMLIYHWNKEGWPALTCRGVRLSA